MADADNKPVDESKKSDKFDSTVAPKGLDKKVITFRQVFMLDSEAAQPQWNMVTRIWGLYRGKIPPELQGTFSKIMINTAFQIVQERIGHLHRNLFSMETGSPSLQADTPVAELLRDQAEDWLVDMVNNTSKLNMPGNFLARTLPDVCIAGTAFRMPYVTRIENDDGKTVPVINSKDVDFFQVLPAAQGGALNPIDRVSDDVLPHFHYIDWWTNDQIEKWEIYEGFDKEQAGLAIASRPTSANELDTMFQDVSNIVGGVDFGGRKNDWRQRMNNIDGIDGRKRVVLWHQRDALTVIVEDRYKIYEGPNPLTNRKLPLASYQCCPDGRGPYGISGLEMVEDLIRSFIFNFSLRSDYLAKVMFPVQWIRNDLLMGRPTSSFRNRPYDVNEFPMSVQDIRKALFIDRMPDVPAQAFQDEQANQKNINDNYGLTDFTRGAPGRMSDNRTATGLVTMVQQAQGRLTTESYILEKMGLAPELQLLLSYAAKFITDDQEIRTRKPQGGYTFSTIEADALSESFTVQTHGTKYMTEKDQSFQKISTLYPMWNQDPGINQTLLKTDLANAAAAFSDVEALIIDPNEALIQQGAIAADQAGGQQAPQLPENGSVLSNNQSRADQRTTVTAGGARQPANQV